MFHSVFDSGSIVRQKGNTDGLSISICKHKSSMILISFQIFEKYKKQPYYFDKIFLNANNNPLHNQRTLSNYILNDCMLLDFFIDENKSQCSY